VETRITLVFYCSDTLLMQLK